LANLTHDPDTLEQEYEALVVRAGLTIPDDRRATMLRCYAAVRQWADTIRSTPRPAAAEPANVYQLATIANAARGTA
jgi:hypothetical protein